MYQESKNVTSDLNTTGLHVALVVATFNQHITEQLLTGAKDCLAQHGIDENNCHVYTVPGALEIPYTIKWLMSFKQYNTIIALGCIIRGDTFHFEIVSNESARAVMDLNLLGDVPIINGILTVDNEQQALTRADNSKGNKGWEAALAALQMTQLSKK